MLRAFKGQSELEFIWIFRTSWLYCFPLAGPRNLGAIERRLVEFDCYWRFAGNRWRENTGRELRGKSEPMDTGE